MWILAPPQTTPGTSSNLDTTFEKPLCKVPAPHSCREGSVETPSCKWAAGCRPLGQFSGHENVRSTHTGVSAQGWAVLLRTEIRAGRLGALLRSRP